MIFEHMETDYTHINTVMNNGLIHFQNLNCMSHTIQYKIKLKNTSTIKLVNIFKDEKYFGDNARKLQSFVIDWGDETITKIFTEYVNTNAYNTDSNTRLIHHYNLPMNKEIIVTIMSESETLVPVPYDESSNGIEVFAMGGELAPITKNIEHPFHPVLKENLVELYSLKVQTGRTLLQRYSGTTLNNLFKGFSKLKSVYGDIFLYGCEKVITAINTFDGCASLSSVPNTLFYRVPKLKDISFMFNECRSIRSIGKIFANKPIEVAVSTFGNCKLLNYVHPENFRNKTNLNIAHIFHGCTVFEQALVLEIFKGSKFIDGGLVYSFAEIQNLETNDGCEQVFMGYTIYSYMFSLVKFKEADRYEVLTNNLSAVDTEGYMKADTKTDAIYEQLPDDRILLKPNEIGESNITNMFSNRTREIMSRPFVFESGVTSLRYQGSLIGHRSLYNDKQIFGRLFDQTQNSGSELIEATIRYTVNILKPNTSVKFIHAHNKFNPQYKVEHGAKAYIKTGVGSEIINAIHADTDNSTDGVISVLYQNIGTYTVEVRYTHCAPVCMTYLNTLDKESYSIETADIELFPTEVPYIGLYGCELWCAKNITGDFFRLFYDVPNTNIFEWKATPNVWMNRIFAYFDKSVVSVSNDIFKSIGFIGNVTELNELFKYEFKSGTGRTMFNNEDFYISVNPFATFNGDIFRFTPEVTKVDTWFNEPVNFKMIQISGVSLNNLFSRLTKIKVINKVLHACELYATTNDNKILWTNNNLVEEIVSYIGRVNYLATDLLVKPKLKKVNRFHLLHMINGADKVDFTNCSMDFANSVNDIDLTEMFFDEHFEIPDGFIKNVKGTLKFNNCFKGSYRFDIANDNSLFVNVTNKTAGDVSGMDFISLAEPLSMEFNSFTTETGTIGLKLKDKDGANHRVVARVYRKDSERYKLICTKHLIITDTDTIPTLNLIAGTLDVKLELWCNSANIYLENLSIMRVKNLSGSYGRTQWVNRVRMQDAYPGLVPSNIICTDAGGPWKNITPTNGTIDFTEMFTGITNKELIDYRILKTNSPAKTTYNMNGTFKNGSIADFDIRMFEFIGDVLINGTSMFERNADENFKFVNLDSGPYIFMEILFSKFKNATTMFKHSSVPKDLFNNAEFFGCDRNGAMITKEEMSINDLTGFMTKWNDISQNSNNPTTGMLPTWKHLYLYKNILIRDMFVGTKYTISPDRKYNVFPKTDGKYSLWGYMGLKYEHEIEYDKLYLGTANLDIAPFDPKLKHSILNDYNFINSDISDMDNISIYNLIYLLSDTNIKYLIEPFDSSFNNKNLAIDQSFKAFQTYAPDSILFRNVKSFTGTSGAELLTYPNYIEYQNIHLTGNQVTFIREELDSNHRFTTYLTVHIKYGSSYEEAKWFVVDKDADSYTVDLEAAKIVGNKVTIKIQSTQCFYLMKTNVDYVETLNGSYRKDLQPRDSEFFNFDVNYYYFIEVLNMTLWNNVKIKPGSKFRFGLDLNEPTCEQNRVTRITGSAFVNQKHITNIDYLFKNCVKFKPYSNQLDGMTSVTSAVDLYKNTSTDVTQHMLQGITNVENGSGIYESSKVYALDQYTVNSNTKLKNMSRMFANNSFPYYKNLPKSFFESISPTVTDMSSLFENVDLKLVDIRIGDSQIPDNTLVLSPTLNTSRMFYNTNILDVRTSWVKEGTLSSNNSIDMFAACSTYEERSIFEAVYGNQTGVTFKCHEPMIYRSSVRNLGGVFVFVDAVDCPDVHNEYVKVVVDSGVFYKTIHELTTTGITGGTAKVEIYSDYAMAFDCDKVERLEGRYPAKNGEVSNNIYFKIGYKYPNLTYIDPNLFDKLVNQTDMSGVFSNLSDISLIQGTLMAPMTKLMYVNSMYAGAKGSISALLDITKYIGPSTNITRYYNLFDSVDIKQVGTGALKIRNTESVNLNNVFNGCNSYIDRNPFNGTIVASVDGMFTSCKSLYNENELITFTKTGASGIEVLKYFAPQVTIPANNSEVNLTPLHDNIDTTKKVDILVDWGDYTTNIMVGIDAGTINLIDKTLATVGNKNLRIWCSYYAVGVKLKTSSSCGIVGHLGGYVGKYIYPLKAFTNTYFPNATTVSSEYLWDVVNLENAMFINLYSKITSIPSRFYKNLNNSIVEGRVGFEDMPELVAIDKDVFVDFKFNSSLNCIYMFAKTPKLTTIPNEIWKPVTNIIGVSGLFNSSAININVNMFNEISSRLKNYTYDFTRTFKGTTIDSVYGVFETIPNDKITTLRNTFEQSRFTNNESCILNIDKFKHGYSINLTSAFSGAIDINNPGRMDYLIFDRIKNDLNFNITDALNGLKSVYTESEIFGGNTTTGVSGLVTDPRTVMTMKVSAGTLSLKPYTNPSYNGKLLIKVNNLVHSLNPYANKSITVAENDIVELITFDNIKDAYMLVDTVGSTAKVKELGGVFNIGPASIVEGKFNKTIAECFGTSVETIGDSFFTQFNTVTSAQNLCKGITSLRTIPNRILSPMVNVTNWANMFEGCTSLQLTDNNSEMFITANKGVTFDYMFKNTGITYIPNRFFKGCQELNKTFIGTFMLCNLTSIPQDIGEF